MENNEQAPEVSSEQTTDLTPNSDSSESTVTPQTNVEVEPSVFNLRNTLNSINEAVRTGRLTSYEASEMRRSLGFSKRGFTKPTYDFARVKRRRKIAKASRKRNRYKNLGKGEKRTSGWR